MGMWALMALIGLVIGALVFVSAPEKFAVKFSDNVGRRGHCSGDGLDRGANWYSHARHGHRLPRYSDWDRFGLGGLAGGNGPRLTVS